MNDIKGIDLTKVPRVAQRAPVEVPGETIRENVKAIAEMEARVVSESLGIQMPATFYTLGTKMLPMGEKKAKRERLQWEKLPLASDGAEQFRGVIRSEQRRDFIAPLSDYRIDGAGYLTRGGDAGLLRITDHAWGQVIAKGKGIASSRLAGNVNSWIWKANGDQRLRTRHPHAAARSRELYGVVSKKYAVLDADAVCDLIAASVPNDARMAVAYDGRLASIEVTLANPYDVDGEIGVGRVHQIGLRGRTADDGSASLSFEAFAKRIACINCTILEGSNLLVEKRHVGDVAAIRGAIAMALSSIRPAMARFSSLWGDANRAMVTSKETGQALQADEAFRRLARGNLIVIPGLDEIEIEKALLASWKKDPGNGDMTRAGMHNAITRLAHEGSWLSPWITEEIEKQASHALYAGEWYQLAEVEERD